MKLVVVSCLVSLVAALIHYFFRHTEDYLDMSDRRRQEFNRLERAGRDLLYEEHA